jgi:hypothetical protein
MLGRQHHVGRAIKCVRPSREDADLSFIVNLEIDFRAFAATNPIALEQLDSFRPIESVQLVKQSLRVGRDS